MANPRQKRKQRSSRPTVRPPNKRKRLLNPLGNDLIAKNWCGPPSLFPSPSRSN